MLIAKLFPDEQYDKKTRHDTDFRATLRAGVHRVYLPASLDAHAGTEVQTGLSPRFQSDPLVLYASPLERATPLDFTIDN
jgi:hypothetical protein